MNEWWEKGKKLLTNAFKNLSIEVNKLHYHKTKSIKNKLLELFNNNPNSNAVAIASLKEQLSKLYERKYEGYRIRAKMQKIENETPDKTFYQKEKEQGKKNSLIELKNQKNETIKKPKEILEEVKEFYNNLWGKAEKDKEDELIEYLEELDKQTFEENEITEINKFIEDEEIEIAIKLLNNESSPGTDGLTAEFYKSFQKLIIPDLKEVFNNALLKGILPRSMREAIVKLLHKKKDFKNLKNWRPISLLNTDYKILSKIIVNRLTPLFQKHILPQQNAGLPKRRMENIHYNIQALLELANQRNEQLIIMTIDFEKAFDKISHHFIFKILEKLKIGNKNLGFIKLFYKNIFSKIEINGDYTSKIKIKRGIRQGCPLSMLLFIISTDLLTRKIQKNEQIKGIKFQNFNFKIAQYADDTTFAFQNYKEIEDILIELKQFEKVSGLKINPEKTQIIATNTFLKTKIETNYPLFKFNEFLKILGVKFYLNPNYNNKNWYELLPKIRSILYKHENRKLSIYGKNQIIKTLIIPLSLHIARIHKPTEKIEKDLNQILFKFLWSNDPIEQLSRKKLISEYKEGGIKMIDITSKFETCYVEKIKYLYNIEKVTELWHQWSLYNLFYKIRHINIKLYNGATAHALYGNKTWNDTFKIFMKLKKCNLNWETITHKEIYLNLKQLKSQNTIIKSINNNTIPWKIITCHQKKYKYSFTNKEREFMYRIASKAFKWQQINKLDKNKNCKFCKKAIDGTEHILIDCEPIKQIWKQYEKILEEKNIAKINLTKDIILYNYFGKQQQNLEIMLKTITKIKIEIIEIKKKLEAKQQYTWNNKQFQKHILEIINTKLKELSDQEKI